LQPIRNRNSGRSLSWFQSFDSPLTTPDYWLSLAVRRRDCNFPTATKAAAMNDNMGIEILRAVRDGRASSFRQLVRYFDIEHPSPLAGFCNRIEELVDANLLDAKDGDPDPVMLGKYIKSNHDTYYSLTTHFRAIQKAL
jgi:hypothetical protein